MPTSLTCPDCGTDYDAGPDEPWRCECGHALEFAESPHPKGNPLPISQLDTSNGLWTFFEFLPIERHVSLHEGFTPLVNAPEWGAQFKLEYVFPTGSFKDRGATTTLSRAVELGVEKVIEDSSGNAGASIATYAARAGLEADIYVPSTVKQSKLMAIQRAGARPVRVDGTREDVTMACISAVEAGEGWYASHAWNPAFYAGTMTFAFELAAQRGWTAPETLVLPIGHGTLFLGAYRGFSLLNRAGIVDGMPRLLGAQVAGYAPIVTALGGETVPGDGGDDPDIADGIQIAEPARGTQIVDALTETGGEVVALGSDPIESALDRLHRGGFYVEPTCAVAPAALRHFRESGVVDEDEDVVVPLTGSGLKTL
ncbi:threonine synthase [Natronobiforma cellulositropha]|uniref:threonine synthase n=1 Tax=Natronobiforma cellulositropha TaxID=1679076 RepID=UPI0021D5E920|nr:threonine synthase [Natronobiforma cellulositropha]